MVRRVRFRPPGVKTGSRVGPLGPFRGTLGIHWVIASVAVALVILLVGSYLLLRAPGPPFREVGELEDIPPGTAREVLGGVFLGRTEDGRPYAVREEGNCPLKVTRRGYLDCTGTRYGFDGRPRRHNREPLTVLALQVHRGDVYVNPLP